MRLPPRILTLTVLREFPSRREEKLRANVSAASDSLVRATKPENETVSRVTRMTEEFGYSDLTLMMANFLS